MVRPREFDPDAVREAAIRCFWTHGYEATSIKGLREESGITAASLYNAFGDKQTLFRIVFERYIETGVHARLRRFKTLPPRRSIETYSENTVQRSLAGQNHKGCMVVNLALEGHRTAAHFAEWRRAVDACVVPGGQLNTLCRQLFHVA